jgi:hypothetical protein
MAIIPKGIDNFNAPFEKHSSAITPSAVEIYVANLEDGSEALYCINGCPHDEVLKLARQAEREGLDVAIMSDPTIDDIQTRFASMITVRSGAAAIQTTHGVRYGVVTVEAKNGDGVIPAEEEIQSHKKTVGSMPFKLSRRPVRM